MSEPEDQAPPSEPTVMAGNKIKGFDISEDGLTVKTYISALDGTIIVTLPTEQAKVLHTEMGFILDRIALARGEAQGEGTGVNVGKWLVGRHEKFPKETVFVFDPGTTHERIYKMADIDALRVADAIEKQVFASMPLPEQQKMIEESRRQPGKIIMPPRGFN